MTPQEAWKQSHDPSAPCEISIREMTAEDQIRGMGIEDSFTVDSVLVLSFSENQFSYTVKDIPSYEKRYTEDHTEPEGTADYSGYINSPDQTVYLVFAEQQVVGYIMIKKNWNNYALIEMIQVDKRFRRDRVGRRLMEQAKRWVLERGLPGIMLETQSNNVRACRFYENCGFVIGGFDLCVYKGVPVVSDEVAVYWYLLF